MIAAGLFGIGTLALQATGTTPVWHDNSPIELSSDFLCAVGFSLALLRAIATWEHLTVRRTWLLISTGFLLIGLGETGIEQFEPCDHQLVIGLWTIAALLLLRSTGVYASDRRFRRGIQLAFMVQVTAHLLWVAMDAFAANPAGGWSALEVAVDSGELFALLTYIVSFALGSFSRLDQQAMNSRRLDSLIDDGTQLHADGTEHRPRICFVYIAQLHQMMHSLPIAAALAKRHPEVSVHIAGTPRHIDTARSLIRDHAGDAPLVFDPLYVPAEVRLYCRDGRVSGKLPILRANSLYFSGFDAIVTPERTSTYLRSQCPDWTRLIGTEHGAGDREVTFSAKTALYDFLLLPGQKQAQTLMKLGYTAPGRHVAGIYCKFDWALQGKGSPGLFDNDRPTVLYNPHFDSRLSSWPVLGWQVLEYFRQSDAYNLIFAPHIRLFDAPTPAKYRPFVRYRQSPHMLIDLGSSRCVDMTYTQSADIYLGDVSSQVVEYLVKPRPCIFLDAHGVEWQPDPHYRFWRLGQVLRACDDLGPALDKASRDQAAYEPLQRTYVQEAFGSISPGEAGPRGAAAIVHYLRDLALKNNQ